MIKLLKHLVPDRIFIAIKYRRTFNRQLNFKKPVGFNEKLNWLKLYDRNPIYTTMVDKYAAKDYISSSVGEMYTVPTIGVWEKWEDIDFDTLPQQFVIKTTHDSGGVCICKDKGNFDFTKAEKKIKESLKTNFYWAFREWPYKNVKPRIIVEEYLYDMNDPEKAIDNWKFYVSYGDVFAYYCTIGGGHSEKLQMTFFDDERNIIPARNIRYPNSTIDKITFPNQLDEMKKLASKLGENIPFLRVDFYYVNNKIYIGELTLYPGAGFEAIVPFKYELEWGSCIKLPKKNQTILAKH